MWTCEMLDWPNPRKQRVSVLAAIAVLTTNPVFAAPLDPVSCLIEPYQTVELSTPVAGILQEVAVDRGDLVTTGQVVARLDSRVETLQRDLARARSTDMTQIAGLEARVAFLTDQAARNADLAKRSALSATEAQKAEMEAELARQELERAKLDQARAVLELQQAEAVLAQRDLVSPIAGMVTERLLDPGEYQDGQSHIVTVARLDVLRVEAFAPIAYFPRLAVGQAVTVTPEAPLDQPRQATIRVIDRVFDAATATFGLRMELQNTDLSLPAGLRCTLSFPES
jgi:RND family efflux transporter MFP subunit